MNLSFLESDQFAEHHFVEGPNEEPVKELAVVDGHAGYAPDELEVGDVLLVAHARVWVDLQRIVVRGRVLEEAVVRVEHVLREQVEPFSGQAAVVQTHLVVKLDPQLRLEDVHLV